MTPLTSMLRNVQEICRIEDETRKARSYGERLSDFITQQSGQLWFISLHGFWFAFWILANSGLIPHVSRFDPFPYSFLTLVVSLEAIFLSLFILMSQNRSNRLADQRAHLDLQINLLAEHESTKTLELLQALCEYHGLPGGSDQEVKELLAKTKPEEILKELKRSLPGDDQPAPPTVSLT